MRYLRVVIGFWRKFIFGDDWIMATTVILAILIVVQLAKAAINAWYFLPVVAVLSLGSSILTSLRPPSKRQDWRAFALLIVVGVFLMQSFNTGNIRTVFGLPPYMNSSQSINGGDPDGY